MSVKKKIDKLFEGQDTLTPEKLAERNKEVLYLIGSPTSSMKPRFKVDMLKKLITSKDPIRTDAIKILQKQSIYFMKDPYVDILAHCVLSNDMVGYSTIITHPSFHFKYIGTDMQSKLLKLALHVGDSIFFEAILKKCEHVVPTNIYSIVCDIGWYNKMIDVFEVLLKNGYDINEHDPEGKNHKHAIGAITERLTDLSIVVDSNNGDPKMDKYAEVIETVLKTAEYLLKKKKYITHSYFASLLSHCDLFTTGVKSNPQCQIAKSICAVFDLCLTHHPYIVRMIVPYGLGGDTSLLYWCIDAQARDLITKILANPKLTDFDNGPDEMSYVWHAIRMFDEDILRQITAKHVSIYGKKKACELKGACWYYVFNSFAHNYYNIYPEEQVLATMQIFANYNIKPPNLEIIHDLIAHHSDKVIATAEKLWKLNLSDDPEFLNCLVEHNNIDTFNRLIQTINIEHQNDDTYTVYCDIKPLRNDRYESIMDGFVQSDDDDMLEFEYDSDYYSGTSTNSGRIVSASSSSEDLECHIDELNPDGSYTMKMYHTQDFIVTAFQYNRRQIIMSICTNQRLIDYYNSDGKMYVTHLESVPFLCTKFQYVMIEIMLSLKYPFWENVKLLRALFGDKISLLSREKIRREFGGSSDKIGSDASNESHFERTFFSAILDNNITEVYSVYMSLLAVSKILETHFALQIKKTANVVLTPDIINSITTIKNIPEDTWADMADAFIQILVDIIPSRYLHHLFIVLWNCLVSNSSKSPTEAFVATHTEMSPITSALLHKQRIHKELINIQKYLDSIFEYIALDSSSEESIVPISDDHWSDTESDDFNEEEYIINESLMKPMTPPMLKYTLGPNCVFDPKIIRRILINQLWPRKCQSYDFLYERIIADPFKYKLTDKGLYVYNPISNETDAIIYNSGNCVVPSIASYYARNIGLETKRDDQHVFPFGIEYLLGFYSYTFNKSNSLIGSSRPAPAKKWKCHVEEIPGKKNINAKLHHVHLKGQLRIGGRMEDGVFEIFISHDESIFHRFFRCKSKVPPEIWSALT